MGIFVNSYHHDYTRSVPIFITEQELVDTLATEAGLLFTLVHWWLPIGPDVDFRLALGEQNWTADQWISMDHIPSSAIRNSRVSPDAVPLLLRFAWNHGYLSEVLLCQSALRAAGLEQYCIASPE